MSSQGLPGEGLDAPSTHLLGEVARALEAGGRRGLEEALSLTARHPAVAQAALDVGPEREGASGVHLTARAEGLMPPRRPPGATLRYPLVEGSVATGELVITLREERASAGVAAWCGVVAAIAQGAVARYRSELLLLQMQRFEIAGGIAAGLVHDFNNLLTTIVASCAVARSRLEAGHPAAATIGRIEATAFEGGEIAQTLLSFVRGPDDATGSVDVNEIAQRVQAVTARALRDGMTLRVELAPGLPSIEGTAMLIEQALANLVLNAGEATPGRGEVTLRTTLVEANALPAGLRVPVGPAARYVAVSVVDAGAGVPEALLERIFEPFFSTKADRSSGLGLAAVLRIAQHHGGSVHVDSREGRGSTFTMFFPVRDAGGA